MQKKRELWMADWQDSHGHRRRKGFKTRRAALQHQAQMRKEIAGLKKAQASAKSRRSPRPGRT